MATIEIKGIDKLHKKLGAVGTVKILREPMHKSLLTAQNNAANYPTQAAGSTYRRTGTLGRAWTAPSPKIVAKGKGLSGTVSNKVGYAPYVQDRALQASVHRGRWQTIQDIVDGNLFVKQVEAFFQKAVDRALAR